MRRRFAEDEDFTLEIYEGDDEEAPEGFFIDIYLYSSSEGKWTRKISQMNNQPFTFNRYAYCDGGLYCTGDYGVDDAYTLVRIDVETGTVTHSWIFPMLGIRGEIRECHVVRSGFKIIFVSMCSILAQGSLPMRSYFLWIRDHPI